MEKIFTKVNWLKGANVYEVNLRQYTAEGTFAAFAQALPRLKDMGITILWFMPITPISKIKRLGELGSYYACSSHVDTNPEFGTIEEFQSLVTEAHALGFKIILDLVANHTGWDHYWTISHPEYFKIDEDNNFYDPNGWSDVIDLDYSNPHLEHAMIDVMKFWVNKCDIDGYRCDMAHLVPLEFWKKARESVDGIKPLFWLAETEVAEYHQVFDATYAWQLLHVAEALSKGEVSISSLYDVLDNYRDYFAKDGLRLMFTSNHDENSHSGSEYERLGNAVRVFAVLSIFWENSLPLIYSGQELPNTKRLRFFEKDQIDWNGTYFMHNFYKCLLDLRKQHPAFEESSTLEILSQPNDEMLVFVRRAKDREILVMLNLSSHSQKTFAPKGLRFIGKYTSPFSGFSYTFDETTTFELLPWEYLVYYN